MSDVTSWFDGIVLRRNPHRAPMIKEVLNNGKPVTSKMLWGKDLTDAEITEKRHRLLDRTIKELGISGNKARAALKDFESD